MNGTSATIEQQVTTFQLIADQHAMINDVFCGQLSDTNAIPHKYPLLWIDLVDDTSYELYTEYVWRVAIFDILIPGNNNELNIKSSYSNEWNIRSNSNRILKDIKLMLRDQYDLQISWGKAKQTPVLEYLNDNLTGFFEDITISIPDITALNDVPLL